MVVISLRSGVGARHANLATTQRYIEGDKIAKKKVVDLI